MIKTRIFCFLLFILFFICCVKTEPVAVSDEDIAEVVFIHQIMDRSQRPLLNAAKKYFLSINSQDVSKDLLEKIKVGNFLVSPASASEKKVGSVRDRVTGEVGTLISIDTIERKKDGSVDVELSVYSNPYDSEIWYYQIVMRDGRCVMKDARLQSIT